MWDRIKCFFGCHKWTKPFRKDIADASDPFWPARTYWKTHCTSCDLVKYMDAIEFGHWGEFDK